MRSSHVRFLSLAVLGLAIAQPANAQSRREPSEKVDTEAVNKIKEEGLKKSQVMETISFLTDVHGPRLTNSPQLRNAAEWTKGRLTKWGLENVHVEADALLDHSETNAPGANDSDGLSGDFVSQEWKIGMPCTPLLVAY